MTLKLKHLGHFSLPRGLQPHDPDLPQPLRQYARCGFGGRAMCMWDAGRALAISGHNVGDLVATVRIPEIGGTAEVRTPFRELAPVAELRVNRLDELVGVAEHQGKIVGLFQRYYDVSGVDGGRKSLWDGNRLVVLGHGKLKEHAGYLTAYDGSLWCGRSSGAGNADVTHGPVLYRVNGIQGLVPILTHVRPDWSEADDYTALAFLPGYVCWLVSKDALNQPWYGTGTEVDKERDKPPSWFSPEYVGLGERAWRDEAEWRAAWKRLGIVDRWNDAKGNHAMKREVWLICYRWPLVADDPGEIVRLDGFHESSDCGGMAYDGGSGILYVHEGYPPNDEKTELGVYPGEAPRIHLYEIEGKPATEPEEEEEEEPAMLRVRAWDEEGREYEGEIPRVS